MLDRSLSIRLSVVAPARNERENVGTLVEEITAALQPLGLAYEIVVVDDHSTDGTRAHLETLATRHPRLRVLALRSPGRAEGGGQSAALRAGIEASGGRLIATLDADLQNDPADLPGLLERIREADADLVQGDRTGARRDSPVRRASAVVGRVARRWLLGDTIRDTGCSLRLMRREVALALPLEYRGMHRFIPITARHRGYRVVEVPVRHRPRRAGTSKYGIWNRALPGFLDCLAVRWMRSRRHPVEVTRHDPPAAATVTTTTQHRPEPTRSA